MNGFDTTAGSFERGSPMEIYNTNEELILFFICLGTSNCRSV